MRLFEWLTFRSATVSIATNDSFAAIARGRGGMAADDVFVVRSAPRTETFRVRPPDPALKQGFAHLVGWVGVIGQQEGLELLVAAADHLVRGLGRDDVHFAVIGFGPHLPVIEAEVRARGLGCAFHLHRAAVRRRPARLAQHRRRLRQPGPEDRDERHLDDEQGRRVHDAQQAGGAVRPEGGPRLGRRGGALRPRERPASTSPRRSPRSSTTRARRARMGAIGRARVEDGLSWAHSAPRLLAAYDRAFAKAARAR